MNAHSNESQDLQDRGTSHSHLWIGVLTGNIQARAGPSRNGNVNAAMVSWSDPKGPHDKRRCQKADGHHPNRGEDARRTTLMVWPRRKKGLRIGGENSTQTKPAWQATTWKAQEATSRSFEGQYAAHQHHPGGCSGPSQMETGVQNSRPCTQVVKLLGQRRRKEPHFIKKKVKK